MEIVTVIVVAVFSAGGAAVIGTVIKGIGGWRAGAARTEAKAIQRLDARATYYEALSEYWRNRAGNAEYVIRTTSGLGPGAVPASGPPPVFQLPAEKAIPDG